MTNPGEVSTLRPVTESDRLALATFTCRAYREPWTDVIEEMVRDRLADELELGNVDAAGICCDDELCGVVAWRLDDSSPPLCRSILLAVRTGHRRRGIGRRLKDHLLVQARVAGAAAVVSLVHWDNDPMIELNVQLGANVERLPGDNDHCRCVIAL